MGNKLKDVFSNNSSDLKYNIQFEDGEAYKKFLEALKSVENNGTMTGVEGVSSISTEIRDGDRVYPLSKDKGITNFFIGPTVETVPFELDTKYGKKTILFKRSNTTNEIILETEKTEIVYIRIVLKCNDEKNTFSYRVQPQLAGTIKEIIESYCTAIVFFNHIFNVDESMCFHGEYEAICKMRDYLINAEAFLNRLYHVEQQFDLSFKPKEENDLKNDQQELEELYMLLYENKVLRLDAKLSEISTLVMTIESPASKLMIGAKIVLTFSGNAEFTIYGQKILIYTANLLSNAIIKEIKEEDGSTKILYGGTDSEPMYISYTGFKTFEEAEQEKAKIMEYIEKYTEAQTLYEYLNKANE